MPFQRGERGAHSILPCLGVFVPAPDTTFLIPLPVVRDSTGKQIEARPRALLVRIMAGYPAYRRGQLLSLAMLLDGYSSGTSSSGNHAYMRANFPHLLSAPAASSTPVTRWASNAAVEGTTRYGLWKHAGKRLCHAIGHWQCEAGAREDFKFVIGIGYVPAGLLNHSRHRRGLRDQHQIGGICI